MVTMNRMAIILAASVCLIFLVISSAEASNTTADDPCRPPLWYDYYYDFKSNCRPERKSAVHENAIKFHKIGCQRRGVIKILMGENHVGLLLDLHFDNPNKYTFHLGGSEENEGRALTPDPRSDHNHTARSPAGETPHDAEIFASNGTTLLGYKSKLDNSMEAFSYPDLFRHRLMLLILPHEISMISDVRPFFHNYTGSDMFGWLSAKRTKVLYLAFNRVINLRNHRMRAGEGLVKVAFKLFERQNDVA